MALVEEVGDFAKDEVWRRVWRWRRRYVGRRGESPRWRRREQVGRRVVALAEEVGQYHEISITRRTTFIPPQCFDVWPLLIYHSPPVFRRVAVQGVRTHGRS